MDASEVEGVFERLSELGLSEVEHFAVEVREGVRMA